MQQQTGSKWVQGSGGGLLGQAVGGALGSMGQAIWKPQGFFGWALRGVDSAAIETLLDQLATAIAEKVATKLQRPEPVVDRLLGAEEAGRLLGVSGRWMYRRGKKLGFARQLGPGTVRYSEAAIRAFMARRP